MLYHQTVQALKGPAKRKFLHDAGDLEGLREFDRNSFNETDL